MPRARFWMRPMVDVSAGQTVGHRVKTNIQTSGVHAILVDKTKGVLIGAADPRREGVAIGK